MKQPTDQARVLAYLLSLVAIAALLAACSGVTPAAGGAGPAVVSEPISAPGTAADECSDEFDPDRDYFPNKASIEYAQNFTVEYHNHYKVVTIVEPWRDAGQGLQYVLVQCGTPPPDGYPDATIIEVPVRTAISMSTTHLGYLEKLSLLDRLIGLGDGKYVNTEGVRQRLDEGELPEVGDGAEVNVEAVLELNPDVVIALGVGNASKDSHPMLLDAGVKVVMFSDFMESSPLGRAEWLKFMALLFNREAEAEAAFAEIAARYQEVAAVAADVTDRPTVFMGYDIRGTWYMPGGDSYAARYLADAGADYLWANDGGTSRIPLDFESVYERAHDAEYWLNLSQFYTSLADVLAADERYGDFAAFQNHRVYNNNARLNQNGGNDYNESGLVNPDIILADIIKILHPELMPDHELVYYRHLQ